MENQKIREDDGVEKRMKNVLLIGDSIREHYQDIVQEILGDTVKIYHPIENCRFTKYALWGMHVWITALGNPKLDLIHWNTGIWDLHRVTEDGKVFTPIDEYRMYTERLYLQMNSYTDKLIWATTTPAGKNLFAQNSVMPEIWNKDVVLYNEAAKEILMSKGNVVINDLYELVLPNIDTYISGDSVHPTPAGSVAIAQQVAEKIRQLL